MNIKRIVALLCLQMMLSIAAFAGGSSNANVEDGNKFYKEFDFKRAVACYLKALKQEPQSTLILQHIADSYRLMNDWNSAKPYYAQLVSHNKIKPQNYVYYAEALREAKDYQNAKIYYEKYLEVFPEDSSVKEQISLIDKTRDLLNSDAVYEITNMKEINTPYSESGVTFYGLNDIYFCSNRKPENHVKRTDSWTDNPFMKIYTAQVDSLGNLKSASLLPSDVVNKTYHESYPCYNEKFDELYFDGSNYNGNRPFFSVDKTVKLKIYKVEFLPDVEKWDGELKEAVPFNSREYSVCQPSLTKRGDTLFFTSDMPGGYGRADVYLSVRQPDGSWGPPVNLGPGINSSGDDMFPFIANDGTLYFASNGHVGIGGLDIFSSKCVNGVWSQAKNLGAPINTNSDDFGYVIRKDNKTGYFCSNRPGGAGDDDIYSFSRSGKILNGITYNGYTGAPIGDVTVQMNTNLGLPKTITSADGSFSFSAIANTDYNITATKPGFNDAQKSIHLTDSTGVVRIPMYPEGNIKLDVIVLDKKSRKPLDSVEVKLMKLPDGSPILAYTNDKGNCTFPLDTNAQYRIEAYKETGDTAEKYLRVSDGVSTKGIYPPAVKEETLELDMQLEKVKKEVPIKIDNIYYDLDKYDIRPDAAIELNKLVKILADNPTMELELSSHTDCRGTADYNLVLSKLRAQSAVDYIRSQGIDRARMTAAGYGETMLVNNCKCEGDFIVPCTEEKHQENRRTEFKIKKF